MGSNLDELEQDLGYRFSDRRLLTRALTHSSSANEVQAEDALDNERLEFLGDSILGWIVSEWLFRNFRDYSEGQLSLLKNYLVSATHLSAAAHQLNLGAYLHLGRGEETGGGRTKQRLLVNAFEAIIAAVYLDSGPEEAHSLVVRHSIPDKDFLSELAGSGPPHDFRAELERLARERKLARPEYVLIGETGPGHARSFHVEVRVGKEITAGAQGSSKKIASHKAAREVCRILRGELPAENAAPDGESTAKESFG